LRFGVLPISANHFGLIAEAMDAVALSGIP
jgi:hypothetical protein